MLSNNKEDLCDKTFEILPEIYDENGVFYLREVISKIYENVYGSYKEDYLDINYSVGVMKDYFIEKELFNIISLPQQPIKMQLNTESKRILNFKEPKREVFYLREIRDIAIDVFDKSNNHILNTSWNLVACLDEKYKDVKYTPELLESVNRFLLQENLLLEISSADTKLNNYYLTNNAKEIKEIGTYKQYKKSIKNEKMWNFILKILPILISLLSLFLSGAAFYLNADKKSEIENLKNEINAINLKLEELHIKQSYLKNKKDTPN